MAEKSADVICEGNDVRSKRSKAMAQQRGDILLKREEDAPCVPQ
jgi:hypothetical protein